MVGSSIQRNKGNASSEREWKLSSNKKRKKSWEKTMFLTNFPPHMNSQDLRKICGEFGTVADVCLPRKLSNSGKRFAFVRFLLRDQEDDASELARKLSGIWIGDYHLLATLARHDKKKPFYQSQKKTRKEDRISALPDCLLLEILSRLHSTEKEVLPGKGLPCTKAAIRTSTLSKRWQHLWTWLPTLIFRQRYFDIRPLPDFVSLVDKTLTQCRQLKLKQFRVDVCKYDSQYESQVNNWICYALRCNVEELYVTLAKDNGSHPNFSVDQSFFICSSFIDLRVAGCNLNPVGAISWKNLKSLSIFKEELDDDLVENILSGSPLLETLTLNCCYGFRRLNITSKILKNLAFCGCHDVSEINAPNILSLTMEVDQGFRNPLLIDVSSLVQVNLRFFRSGYYDTDGEEKEAEQEQEKSLKDFILNLPNVKELKIGGFGCGKVASRLEAKGFVFPSNMKVDKSRYWFSGPVPRIQIPRTSRKKKALRP